MEKAGARSKLTEAMIEELCALKGTGLTNRAVCDGVGISERVLYDWISQGEDDEAAGRDTMHVHFLQSYKKAMTAHKLKRIKQIQAAATEGNWQAAAWELERCYPDEYGKRVKADITGAVPVVITGGGDVEE